MNENKKIKVAVLFGGKSAEHEVSLHSAENVMHALDPQRYEIVKVKIDREGNWQEELLDGVDVVFPVLHGPYGEDGSMQGYLKIKNLPFVGPGVLGSAVAMDKDVTKRLLREAGLPVVKFLVLHKNNVILSEAKSDLAKPKDLVRDSSPAERVQNDSFINIKTNLGLPFILKPANMGSSIGVAKVKDEEGFKKALNEAFSYDTKVIAEEYIDRRELECSVLGNEDPQASVPGEIVASHELYDYDAKYIDEDGAALIIPADLPEEKVKEIQELSIKTFKTLCLEGMARIDFFMDRQNKLYINEANTIPGFTNISMYPKLWEASGIGYSELVDRLIDLAIERFEREKRLKSTL